MLAVVHFFTYHQNHAPIAGHDISAFIFGDFLYLSVGAVFLNAFAFLFLRFSRLPAPLFYGLRTKSGLNLFTTSFCVVFTFIVVLTLFTDWCYSNDQIWLYLLPSITLALYLLLAGRAAFLLGNDLKKG
ncbi:hypothetical protein BH10CYA1_BH10CYA1_03540 [soil metagenome]